MINFAFAYVGQFSSVPVYSLLPTVLAQLQILNHKFTVLIFRRLPIAMKAPFTFVMYVLPSIRLSACITSAPTERIFMKFDIGDFYYETLSRKFKFG